MNKKSRKWLISISVTLGVLILLWAISAAVAQGPGPQAADAVNSRISYQGVLKENGVPVTGSRDMIFRLYSDDICYTPVGEGIFKTGVPVRDGRFSVQLDVVPSDFNGQGLWLEVQVDSTTIGCQEILPAPYALSLRPGAVIQGDVASPSAVLNVVETTGGWGVYGSGGTGGVHGSATMTDTVTYGVYGQSNSSQWGDAGVYGSGNTYGVYGSGYSYGVYGSGNSYGLYGYSSSGTGVYGYGGSYGVYGYNSSTSGAGVYGLSSSNDGFGLAGHNYSSGVGVGAWSWNGNLIEAYDGDFPGGTLRFYIDQAGNVWADGGFYSFAGPAGESARRAVSAIQSPEAWFEDFGTAALADGRAIVTVEPLFAETVNLGVNYHVFLTPLGDCQGFYVAEKTATSFEVRELGGGKANVSFDYRIVAKRLGYEDARLEEVVLPEPVEVERSDVPELPEPEPLEPPGR